MSLFKFSNFFSVKVDSLAIEYGNKEIGFRLYEYQERVLELSTGKRLIAIDAPTGAGKTLALLLAFKHFFEDDRNAMILYPTKALIEDQQASLSKLVEKIGIDVDVVSVDSDRLHEYMLAKGFKTHGEALYDILSSVGPKLVLTNPDILYYILRMEFKKGRPIFRELATFAGIGIDELHLYWGASLQILFTFLNLMKGKLRLLSTATHDYLLLSLLSHIGDLAKVKARKAREGAKVRHEVELTFASIKSDGVLYKDEEAEKIANTTLTMLDRVGEGSNPRVVCIVNSLVFSEKVAEKIREREKDVSLINSLTPRGNRSTNSKIVVGTSAIEVGIDFDTQALVFEATNTASFIQRLGRVGRKRSGIAVAFTPYDNFRELKAKIPEGGKISYTELENAVKHSFAQNPSYAEVAENVYGALIQAGITYTLVRRLIGKDKLLRVLTEVFKCSSRILPPSLTEVHKELIEVFNNRVYEKEVFEKLLEIIDANEFNLPKRLLGILRSFMKIGVRGVYSSLPAYILKYKTLGSIDIGDLGKVDFEYISNEEEFIEKIGLSPLDIEYPIIVIRGVLEKGYRIAIRPRNFKPGKIFLLSKENLYVNAPDPRLQDKIAKLLDGVVAYVIYGKPADWRFSALKLIGGEGWVILGPDAIIQAWLDESIDI